MSKKLKPAEVLDIENICQTMTDPSMNKNSKKVTKEQVQSFSDDDINETDFDLDQNLTKTVPASDLGTKN